jgi:hypothetical protein
VNDGCWRPLNCCGDGTALTSTLLWLQRQMKVYPLMAACWKEEEKEAWLRAASRM